jgi:hypothetical protein
MVMLYVTRALMYKVYEVTCLRDYWLHLRTFWRWARCEGPHVRAGVPRLLEGEEHFCFSGEKVKK